MSAGNQASAAISALVFDALGNRRNTGAGVTQSTRGIPGSCLWGQGIAGGFRQSGAATTTAYGAVAAGFVQGQEFADGSGRFGGLTLGRALGTSFSTTTAGAFAGLYGSLGEAREYAVSLGFGTNASGRQVAGLLGLETASASFGSLYLNASLMRAGLFGSDKTALRLRYAGALAAGYTETGSSANLTVGARMSHNLAVRFEHSTALSGAASLRYGADAHYATGSVASLTLAGGALSVNDPQNGFGGRGFLAVDFAGGASRATGTAELGLSDGGRVDANVSFKVRF